MEINKIAQEIYDNAAQKGWHDKPVAFGDAIANLHAELSEAFEEYRNNRGFNEVYYEGDKPCGIPSEFADVIIRLLDSCVMYGIDIEKSIAEKVLYNKTRDFKHGGKQV
jgi:NTP pyrophosphatase (non-canonical NTP hydrolase)